MSALAAGAMGLGALSLGALAGCARASTGYPLPESRYRVLPVSWEAAGSSGRTLTVTYRAPKCALGPAQASVRETTQSVEVALTVVVPVGGSCDLLGAPQRLRVDLAAPLGARRLRPGTAD